MVISIFIGLLALMIVMLIVIPYYILKSVQMGLRWQIETKKDISPTMPTIISEQLEKKEMQQQQEKHLNILSEWFGGADTK